MQTSWVELFSAALSGGVVVKALEFTLQWLQTKSQRDRSAKDIVNAHLDPLLKAADEIVGKTRSLAERDFKALIQSTASEFSEDLAKNPDQLNLLYLFAQFWGQIEILNRESLAVSITNDKRGAVLQEFLACLESQRIRLVDRVHQKAIGEITTYTNNDGKLRTISLVEFASMLSKEQANATWLKPLMDILGDIRIKKVRQRVLVYGVVMHSLIDTLDPKHNSTHDRPSFPNKLSKKSCRDIKFRVFKQYLKQVRNIEKYVG